MYKKALIASSVFLLSAAVQAEGGYIGLSFGKTDMDLPGFDDGNSVAVAGGFKVNTNFAIEASYVDLGESDDDVPPVWTLEVDGLNFAAVGIIPLSEKAELFGKIGMLMWDVRLSEDGSGEIGSDDGTDLSFGFGVSANLTEQFGVVLEYQKFDLDDEDVSNISLGGRLNF